MSGWGEEELVRRGVAFRGKALPALDWPFECDEAALASIATSVAAVCRATEIVTEAFVKDVAVRSFFGYGPLQEECVLKDPGYLPAIPLGRLDSFVSGGAPKFMEFNTDGTAGWHYASALTALWREGRGLPKETAPLPERLVETLLACFRQWDHVGVEKPRIALVDWAEVGTRPEQEALVALFESRGYPASREDPRSLSLANGRLVGSRGPIDLVYRRLVSEEAFPRALEIRPFLDAFLEGAACFVGSFRTDPAWSKLLFAVLSDPSFEHLFPPGVLEVLRACIPWTRRLAPGVVAYEGREWPLEDLLLSRRTEFVIKPARGFEGKGVVAGELASEESWRRGVRRAMATGGWVAQAYVRPVTADVPGVGRAFLQAGEFVLRGKLAGFLPRLSPSALITPEVREWYLPSAVEVAT